MAKKKGTPAHLDQVIRNREVIGEEQYTDFWHGFNKLRDGTDVERQHYVDGWLSDFYGADDEDIDLTPTREELMEVAADVDEERERKAENLKAARRGKRIVRKSKGWATRDARRIGGRVVRVDRFGKPNPRGRSFKAVL